MAPGFPFPASHQPPSAEIAGFVPIGRLAARVVLSLDGYPERPRPYACRVEITHPRFSWPSPEQTWHLALNALLRAAS